MNNSAPMKAPAARWSPRLATALSGAADLATASLMLARHDVPVFPCVPGGKQPLTAHGFLDATADVATVHEWWRRWPERAIATRARMAAMIVSTSLRSWTQRDTDAKTGGAGTCTTSNAAATTSVGRSVDGASLTAKNPTTVISPRM